MSSLNRRERRCKARHYEAGAVPPPAAGVGVAVTPDGQVQFSLLSSDRRTIAWGQVDAGKAIALLEHLKSELALHRALRNVPAEGSA